MREFDYIIIGGGCAGLSLASNVYKQEEEKEEEKATWKVLSGRRVKQFGGTVNAQRTIGKPLPKFLKELSLNKLLVLVDFFWFWFNQV